MNFSLTEEHEMIRESAAEFAQRELAPHAAKWDAEESFSWEAFQAAGEDGLLGLTIPEEYGGAGLGNLHASLMLEEINRVEPGMGVTISVHMSLVCGTLIKFGTEQQKEKYLPKLASGEWLGAYAVTEAQAGSDAGSLKCAAEKVDGGYELTGSKAWITSGAFAQLFVVYALTDPSAPAGKGITCFLVEASADGFSVGKKEAKLGLRSSSTTEILLDGVFVSDENIVGELNRGFPLALAAIDGGRIGIASQALGIHRGCLEDSVKYASEREQFGKPINRFQGVAFKLADMATELETARLLVHKAAWLRDEGLPCTKECSMAKLFAAQVCNKAAQDAVQIHGGAGYTKEFAVERYYRDARITEIYEGAADVQRIVISRTLS
ncbi:MAG: acyl-CoA dehydrogenase [Planctomycetes bacterium]|jgi:alkylation response protein AidB-like acyl-CoA dehydrogenase|nr:acyl-CoA dehydrogenase [Planctomycetota bacterium]MBT4028007.1 acyl-CoA dehydrogenase [Planctomycetota bacterium]MBT4561103.1 acyl-CoA dehydrogenase [Planctomycetota bacterium]MBT5100645.1 acyl-CoA dehydrogenase [Planctomycetota bacterium]MBT5120998.1 acyl-CoA dehydrogenase [Planctomycetota bacterium]